MSCASKEAVFKTVTQVEQIYIDRYVSFVLQKTRIFRKTKRQRKPYSKKGMLEDLNTKMVR